MRQPGAAARAGRPPRRRGHLLLRPRPARAGARAGGKRAAAATGVTRRRAPEKLWEPSAELVERSRLTEFMRWLEAERGLALRGLRRALALVGRRPRGLLGRDLGLLRGRRPTASAGAVLGQPRDARRRVVPRHPAQLRRARLRRQGRRRDGDPPRLRAARARRAELGRAARPGRRGRRRRCAGSGSSAATASSPTCRTSPRRSSPSSPAASIGAVWSSCSPDFGPASVDRPLRPDRAQGPVRGRRLPLRRQGLRPPRDRSPSCRRRCRAWSAPSSSPTSTPSPTSRRCATRSRWDELLAGGEGAELELRARPLRPPALGPLLLRHHRAAEGDRPGPGRDPARAPEEAPPPRRRPPRRPPLLVHDDRLDDVELPRLRAADQGGDRPLRRQPRPPRHGRALGPGRARRGDDVRHQRRLHRRLHEGRGRARRRPRPQPPRRRSARPAPRSPPRASTGSTSTSAPTPGCSRPAAAPTSAPPSSAASRCCRSTAASCRRGRWAPRSRPGTRTATRSSTRSASWS